MNADTKFPPNLVRASCSILRCLKETVQCQYVHSKRVEDVLFDLKTDWLDSLLLIIKTQLLQMTFHESYVCMYGGDALYQQQWTAGRRRDAVLRDEQIRRNIEEAFKDTANTHC